MPSGPQTPVAKDDPLMVAWEAYQTTEDFANSKRWAEHVTHQYLQGSLWGVFMAGFFAGQASPRSAHTPKEPGHEG
jgi:hypothetical protein